MSGSRGEVDELRRKLGRERALRREFEEAAIAAARELEDVRDELEFAMEGEVEAREGLEVAYTRAVASLVGLVSELAGRIRAVADGGEAGADGLRALAVELADMPEGQLIALGSKTLAAVPGEGQPTRCMDCRGYGCARFAFSGCRFRPGANATHTRSTRRAGCSSRGPQTRRRSAWLGLSRPPKTCNVLMKLARSLFKCKKPQADGIKRRTMPPTERAWFFDEA